jgi:4-nitrophenyl phosphatase
MAIPGSADAIRRLADGGVAVIYATNNSMRTPEEVAHKIETVMGVAVDPGSIVTSALAAAAALPDDVERCLIIGGGGLVEAVEEAGRVAVSSGADAVVVGLDPEFTYEKLKLAADEIRQGAVLIASNVDPTYPVSSGVVPGAGSIVAAIETATAVKAIRAGKPEAHMRALIRALGVGSAWVVGDRVDTDIRMASHEADWTSVLVMTGVATVDDDNSEADHVATDLESAVDLVFGATDRS